MNFRQALKSCFRQYFGFTSRASRAEFWWFMLFVILVHVALGVVLGILESSQSLLGTVVGVIVALFSVFLVFPSLAVSVRRLHDVDKSGWWLLISFVPVIGSLLLLYWYVQPSQAQTNAYGVSPFISNADTQWAETHMVTRTRK